MASIGKFALSLASGDASLALANINFDFSIVKMDAPAEYQGLGNSLSKKRKFEAEEGTVHATARKLGALFVDDLPSIPHLAQAYGLRVSEIAARPEVNPMGDPTHGALAGHVGADGTSIWAAATSGKGALQVHLLACMLARIWSGPETTAIWTEMVAARKKVLLERLETHEFSINSLIGSRIEIQRTQLAEWDASARSWLRSADQAKLRQQTQLMLIIDNIRLRMASKPQVYETVLPVWIKAMTTMESIVSGVAQNVRSPEVLLGLSSWHIYPDMYVLGDKPQLVQQKDALIPQGCQITLGLSKTDTDDDGDLSWSMPLARLRYYGRPVTCERSIGTRTTRVAFRRLIQIVIGSAISAWNVRLSDLHHVCQFLQVLAGRNQSVTGLLKASAVDWLDLFNLEARKYLQEKEAERRESERYISLGYRRYPSFLADSHPAPMFGLSDFQVYLDLLTLEDQIAAIRELATSNVLPEAALEGAIIRYYPLGTEGIVQERYTKLQTNFPEIATVCPYQLPNDPRKLHRRWIAGARPYNSKDSISRDNLPPNDGATLYGLQYDHLNSERDSEHDELLDVELEDERATRLSEEEFVRLTIRRSVTIMQTSGEPCGFLGPNEITMQMGSDPASSWNSQETARFLLWTIEQQARDASKLQDWTAASDLDLPQDKCILGWRLGAMHHCYQNVKYRFLFGSSSVKVFQPITKWRKTAISLPLHYLTRILSTRSLKTSELTYYLRAKMPETDDYWRSLQVLFQASVIYRDLDGAEVDLSVLSLPLNQSRWVNSEAGDRNEITQKMCRSFACIVLLESGTFNLAPDDFNHVVGISSGNSLYVSEALLEDPSDIPQCPGIRRLVGNIGKPGVALMLLAKNPDIWEPDLESWEMINHMPFDGRIENNFRGTSLHLSLTGDEMPLNIGQQGACDKEVAYVEAIISAYDHGVWVADIDILGLFSRAAYSHLPMGELQFSLVPQILPTRCSHSEDEKLQYFHLGELTSVDCWSEVLDRPPTTAVIRASGNWIARLALAAVMLEREDTVLICGGQVCWACITEGFASIIATTPLLDGKKIFILC